MIGQLDLQALRRARNITQKEMAKLLGIHENTYVNWEHNPDKITISYAVKIANILNATVDDIFLKSNSTEC